MLIYVKVDRKSIITNANGKIELKTACQKLLNIFTMFSWV